MYKAIFLTADQVMEQLQVSKQKAYKIIQQLNRELDEQGLITVRGRVNADYFYERCCYQKKTKGGE